MTATKSDTYNGWANRETWATQLWLTNDELTYNLTKEYIRQAVRDGDNLPTAMREHVEDMFALDMAPDGMQKDIGSIWRVDWEEIAKAWLED